MEPAPVDVGRDAVLQLEVADGDVGDARTEMGVLMQSGSDDAAGDQVEKDRQVVGCRVPPYVGITPDASHAEPLEGEVVELAEHTAIDQPLHLADERIVKERLVDEQ